MSKRIVALSLTLCLMGGLAACQDSTDGSQQTDQNVENLISAESVKTSVQYLCNEGFDYAEEFTNGYAFAVRGSDCGYVDMEGNFTVCYTIDDETYDSWFGADALVYQA